MIVLIQDVAHCTGPYHLICRQQRTGVIFMMPSFCCSESEGVLSLSLMPQIQQIMALSLQRSRHSPSSFGPHVLLPWSIANRMQASYTLLRILGEWCLEVRTGKSFLNFSQAMRMQHLAAIVLSQPPSEHSMSPGSRKWLPHQAWCHWHLSIRIRGKVYEACIHSAMLHGSETWGPHTALLARKLYMTQAWLGEDTTRHRGHSTLQLGHNQTQRTQHPAIRTQPDTEDTAPCNYDTTRHRGHSTLQLGHNQTQRTQHPAIRTQPDTEDTAPCN